MKELENFEDSKSRGKLTNLIRRESDRTGRRKEIIEFVCDKYGTNGFSSGRDYVSWVILLLLISNIIPTQLETVWLCCLHPYNILPKRQIHNFFFQIRFS